MSREKKNIPLQRTKKPRWLSRKLPVGPKYQEVRELVRSHKLATVCQEARCPNQFECYSKGSATFMILGDTCTRNCRFCNVEHGGSILKTDKDEPLRVAEAVNKMALRYAVITSVTRDDLDDGGAALFAETIKTIRTLSPETLVEVLIPDLQGNWESLQTIVEAKPDVLNHNIETVEHLYELARPEARYDRSLELLRRVKLLDPSMVTKSGVMVGLGETDEELKCCIQDVQAASCDILIIGQYLQPTKAHLAVQRYVSPEEFKVFEHWAMEAGFRAVVAEPLVRSSYRAEELYEEITRQRKVTLPQ